MKSMNSELEQREWKRRMIHNFASQKVLMQLQLFFLSDFHILGVRCTRIIKRQIESMV